MFKKINKKLFLIVLGSIFAGIVLTVIGIQGANATSKDSFCLSCHDAPEFIEQRAITPHGKIGCLECHGDGFLNDKISGSGHLWNTITGAYHPNNYDEYVTEVPNEKCLSCHNIENNVRDESVATMHLGFIEQEQNCTNCHDQKFMHGVLGDFTKQE